MARRCGETADTWACPQAPPQAPHAWLQQPAATCRATPALTHCNDDKSSRIEAVFYVLVSLLLVVQSHQTVSIAAAPGGSGDTGHNLSG